MSYRYPRRMVVVTFGVALAVASSAAAQSPTSPPTPPDPPYRADRGPGVATSMFGTYVRGGELLVYPFVEHYRDRNFEYKPSEFGFVGDVDHRGRYRASEALFFLAYGLTDDLAIELEGAAVRASLDKAASDLSAVPARIAESGVGDIEGQLRWRWKRETATGPEAFSYVEAVSPRNRDKLLIGTSAWELKLGTGVSRGFGWGTLTARAAVEYTAASSSRFDLGEYAVEYPETAVAAVAGLRWPRRHAGRGIVRKRGAVVHPAEHFREVQQRYRSDVEGDRLGAGGGRGLRLPSAMTVRAPASGRRS